METRPASSVPRPLLSTTATTASFDGQYPITITVGTLSAANYDFNTVDGILTVTETPDTTIVLTANPGITSTYGQTVTFTATFIPFDSEAVPPTGTVEFEIDGTPIGSPVTLVNNTATSDTVSGLYVGTYTVEAVYSGDSFYSPNSQSTTQTVTPAPLTITADNQTKVYGAAVPTLTASYSGFVYDETSASLTTLPTLSTTATVSSDVSGNPYTITASGAVDSNYAITYVAGVLTVTPADLTITADNQTSVYGAALPTLTASYSGFVAGDTAANLTTQPTLATTATASSHVGLYSITANGAVDSDYTISYVDGSLTITPAPLTITADNQTNVYGRHATDPHRQLHGVCQWRHLGQPDHAAYAIDIGNLRKPCRRESLSDHRQRRGGCRLLDHLCRGELHRHGGTADDHCRQSDERLRFEPAAPHRELHRLRQR